MIRDGIDPRKVNGTYVSVGYRTRLEGFPHSSSPAMSLWSAAMDRRYGHRVSPTGRLVADPPYMRVAGPDFVFIDEVDTYRPSREQWIAARKRYGQMVHEIIEKSMKEENKMQYKTTQEDSLKGAQFEIEELRTEVSNLNDELSETRQERETLRATLDRTNQNATLLEGTVKRLEAHVSDAKTDRNLAIAQRDEANTKHANVAEQLDTAMLVIDQLVRQRDGVDPTQPNPFDVRRILDNRMGRPKVELKVVDSRAVMGLVRNPFVLTTFSVVKAEQPKPRVFFDVFEYPGIDGSMRHRF